MIVAHRIRQVDEKWLDHLDAESLATVERAQKFKLDIIKASTGAWCIYADGVPVFFFGVIRGSWLGHGVEMWFMTCKNTKRLLRHTMPFACKGIRRIIRLYGHAKATVAVDFARAQRFVEFFGFRRVGEMIAADEKRYYVYEMRSPWLQQQ